MAYTTIKKPSDYFNTVLYTGNGSTQSITGVGFQPDWVWGKERTSTSSHFIFDSVRGATKNLHTNTTAEETIPSPGGGLTSFDSDGFSASSWGAINESGQTYVAWNWYTGATASSNTDGSITSNVSANTTSGFSIVSYAGGGSDSDTVGHGLGVTPAMVIVKNRDNTNGWLVSHQGLTSESYNVSLNNTNAEETTSGHGQGIVTNKTSSTFGFSSGGVGDDNVNDSNYNYIAYCFAEKKGFSKFGKIQGNGNADGPFCYLGFSPAFVLYKKINGLGDWYFVDNRRPGYNDNNKRLYANTNQAEETYNMINLYSNGFKITGSTHTYINDGAGEYIYMAFAEEPLVGDNPCTAR